MKKTVISGMFILIFILSISLNAQWIKTYGTASSDDVHSIQQTFDGGYIVAGGGGVFKLSASGDIEWKKGYGFGAYSVQQTFDGGYIVAGGKDRDAGIFKLSPNGKVEWQKTYGGSDSDYAHSIQQTLDGGYIVGGEYAGRYEVGRWYHDAWILKLSSLGDIEWQKSIGKKDWDERIYSIQQTLDGGYITIADAWILKLFPNGDLEWQKHYEKVRPDLIQQTYDGGYIVAGSLASGGYSDFWVFKLSANGDIKWQKSIGTNGSDDVHSIQQIKAGGYVVAGTMGSNRTNSEIWILKLTRDGKIIWQKTYGGCFDERASCIQQTMDGGYIVAGTTESFGAGSFDILILKLFSNGEINHCKFVKNSNEEIVNTDVIPDDQELKIKNTHVTPMETYFSARNIRLKVFNLCTDRPLLTILPSGGGTTAPKPGTHVYDLGTDVTITANPDTDYNFYEWQGDASGSTNPITITMDSDKSIKASFMGTTDWGGGGGGGGDGGGGGGGGNMAGCFIATAAYGSFLHPHVKILREFRDKYLMPYKLGRSLVDFYYKYSPSVARFIAKHKALKIPVQISLLPLVSLSYFLLLFGPVITVAMILFLALLPSLFFKISRRKRKIVEQK